MAPTLNNLRGYYVLVQKWPKAIRTVERLAVLHPSVTAHIRDLGGPQNRSGAIGRAFDLPCEYVLRSPGAPDVDGMRQGRDRLRVELTG